MLADHVPGTAFPRSDLPDPAAVDADDWSSFHAWINRGR